MTFLKLPIKFAFFILCRKKNNTSRKNKINVRFRDQRHRHFSVVKATAIKHKYNNFVPSFSIIIQYYYLVCFQYCYVVFFQYYYVVCFQYYYLVCFQYYYVVCFSMSAVLQVFAVLVCLHAVLAQGEAWKIDLATARLNCHLDRPA